MISDSHLRGWQWGRLLGQFLHAILGPHPAAWAEASRCVIVGYSGEYFRLLLERAGGDYGRLVRLRQVEWMHGMRERIGILAPGEEVCVDLAQRAYGFVIPRLRAAMPGALETIRFLHAAGYQWGGRQPCCPRLGRGGGSAGGASRRRR